MLGSHASKWHEGTNCTRRASRAAPRVTRLRTKEAARGRYDNHAASQ